MLVRGIEADVLPTCLEYGMGVIPWSPLAGGWLSGKWRKGADDLTSRRSALIPQRYDLSIPANQAKLDAADALGQLADETGISLIHMALAFVIRHPAVTAAIIGPRTMEQLESQIGAATSSSTTTCSTGSTRSSRPATTINPTDAGWTNPALDARGAPQVARGAAARRCVAALALASCGSDRRPARGARREPERVWRRLTRRSSARRP